MIKFFIACFLIIPWVAIPNNADCMRLPKETFFDLTCLGMICLALFYGLRFFYRNKYLSWLTAWVFFSITLNWFLPMTIFRENQPFNIGTLPATMHFILGLGLSFVALSYFDKEDYAKIAKAVCFSAVIITCFGMMQVLGFDPFGRIAKWKDVNFELRIPEFVAMMDNRNNIGNYLCLSLPFFLFFKEKKYKICFVLVFMGVLLSKSILAAVASVVGVSIYLLLNYRNIKMQVAILSGSILTAILVFFQPHVRDVLLSGFSGRIECWKRILIHIKDNPLFGQGLGIVKFWNIKIDTSRWLNCHNDYLEIICMIGILGLFLLLLVIINSLRNFNYKPDNKIGFCYLASFVSFLVLMTGSFPVEIAPTALFGLLTWWGVEKL